jgi:hypothetical protein
MSLLKILAAITLAFGLIAATTACQPSGNTNVNTTINVNKPAANTNADKVAEVPAANTSNAGTSDASTPTAAYKAAYAARKNKDVAALKKLMSKDLLEFLTELGQIGDKKQSLDEVLIDSGKEPKSDETRNEKINGDRATLEYRDEGDDWDVMDFVKEDGMWKMTLPPIEDRGMDDLSPVNKGKKK